MRNWLLKQLDKFIINLLELYNKYSYKDHFDNILHHLAPTDEAEKADKYLDVLDWALHHRDKIKNIAITGAFGSGKSSIIKTFQKKRANKEFAFLPLSLATFSDAEEITTKESGKNQSSKKIVVNENTLRLIEFSLLQQLFYHENDKKIPNSRFKKIQKEQKGIKYLISIFLIAYPLRSH